MIAPVIHLYEVQSRSSEQVQTTITRATARRLIIELADCLREME